MGRSNISHSSASTTVPKRSVRDNEKALQQAKSSRTTRAAVGQPTNITPRPTSAAPAKDRSPSISPARNPYSHKRKNPVVDHVHFAEDTDDEGNDKEFEELSKKLEDKQQRLSDSDEAKAAARKIPKPKQQLPAKRVSDGEKKMREQDAETAWSRHE